jgi:pimeloyl-ACP methyl ester carboxylesterase
MHHGIGSNRHIFDGWLPAVMLTHRVLRFDMRGHGESGGESRGDSPADGQILDMDRLSEDLLAVMDAAGVDRTHLLGESIGATIALHTALRRPNRVISVTMSNGAHFGASIQAVEGWRALIERDGMAGWSAFMMEGRFAPGAISAMAWAWFDRQQATADPKVVLRLLAALVGTDLLGELAGLRPPLMILHPDRSPFIPVSVIGDLLARVPSAELHVFGGARHGLPFSHAAVCAGLLRDFVGRDVSTVDRPDAGH